MRQSWEAGKLIASADEKKWFHITNFLCVDFKMLQSLGKKTTTHKASLVSQTKYDVILFLEEKRNPI